MDGRTFTMIAAVSLNGTIGDGEKMPWMLKADLKHFRDTTMGHVVIMGRKTFDSIGNKPLKGRVNIVLTRSTKDTFEEVRVNSDGTRLFFVPSSLAAMALTIRLTKAGEEIFVIGGQQIYNEFIVTAKKLIITHVAMPAGGLLFPHIDFERYQVVDSKHYPTEDIIPFTIVTYERPGLC